MSCRMRGGLAAFAGLGLATSLGACGGASEAEAEPSTEALIAAFCEKEAAAACAAPDTKQECLDEQHERVGFAQQEGCDAELRAYLKCGSNGKVTCSGYDGELFPHVDEACNDLNDAFFYCYTKLPAECAVGSGVPGYTDTACTIKCVGLSSLCHGPDGGPYACACDSGPHAGTTFESSECGSMKMIWATGHYCT